ncbi:MAG: DUF2892 domain-containing protein [Deltaproteobacteria bacterium]
MINIGIFERILRIVGGMLIFSLYFVLQGNIRYIGLIGLIPIITGSIGTCPIYAVLGINSNRVREK